MSIIPPALGRLLNFYLSGPLPCPYLPGRIERKLFTRLLPGHLPAGEGGNADINAMLTRAGFRRSHDIVYRPACPECNACVPVRIPVANFAPSRTLRRGARRNRDLALEILPAQALPEHYDLFMRYQAARHPDGDMARMDWTDFAAMVAEGEADTRIYQLRYGDGALAGCMIADGVGDGVSAVYSFFTPDQPQRSLGLQLILTLIETMRRDGKPYVYLGYWIAAARKMAYKNRFQPLQALGPNGWDWVGD
jgi:arginine-tRNA-protein transferase